MQSKQLLFLVCFSGIVLLSGCSGMTSSGGGGSSFASTAGVLDGGGDDGGVDPALPRHNPEPITMALFGSGLAAFAISKRKRSL